MLIDIDRIRLLAILYGSPDPAGHTGSPLPQWTTMIPSVLGPVGHIHIDGVDELFWPGSKTAIDWWADFDALPIEVAKLGLVHAGFLSKPTYLKGRLDALCGPLVRVSGHSLGAADAEVYSALRLAEGRAVAEIIAFGSPMPGCQPMKDVLAPVPMRNYRNGWHGDLDPVPGVPLPIPIEFPCVQMRDPTVLAGEPDVGDTSDFRLHHSQCYFRGLVASGLK